MSLILSNSTQGSLLYRSVPAVASDVLSIAYQLLRQNLDPSEKCHYSFITNKNRIIAIGANQMYKTSPLAKRYGYRYAAYHSELSCWQNCPRDIDFRKCRLFNVRLSRSSIRLNKPILRNSKPCEHCWAWLEPLSLREIWYTTDEGWNRL